VRGLKRSIAARCRHDTLAVYAAFFFVVNSAAFAALTRHHLDMRRRLPGLLCAGSHPDGDLLVRRRGHHDLVVDITSSYFDKLMIAPIHHLSIVIWQKLAVALRAAVADEHCHRDHPLVSGSTLVTGLAGFPVSPAARRSLWHGVVGHRGCPSPC